jgi:hypothetical protein
MLAQAVLYHSFGSRSAGGMAKVISYLNLGIVWVNGLCLASFSLASRCRSIITRLIASAATFLFLLVFPLVKTQAGKTVNRQ